MRVSLGWLADYIDLPTAQPAEIAAALASLGHEVETIETLTPDWAGVQVGVVEMIRPHPHADRVRLCTVDTGDEQIEVVCGAWNFSEGAKVAFAVEGARLAGGVALEGRTIRGVESKGMILSERELGLGDDHAGILTLDPATPLGTPLEAVVGLPDVVLDLSITTNRPDVMSMVGVARELSAFYRIPYRLPPLEPPTVPGVTGVGVTIEDPSGCLRFVAREVRGITPGPSPLWLRQRLRAAGVRPISSAVDVTNYVMLELGQPLHAFDLDRLREGRIVVRRATEGESLRTLDGVKRTLSAADLVVADGSRPVGLAGTMGGEESEVGESTTRVLLEAAAWDPPTVMFMSRRHGLRSEASARFERGVDPNLPPSPAARAARLLVEMAGGECLEGWVDEVAVERRPWQVELSLATVARVLGEGFDPPLITGLLERLHLEVEGTDPLRVTVPTFRPDLTRPIDLVEEVARLWGYHRFGETVPTGAAGGWTVEQQRRRRLRAVLTGAGLSQAISLPFLGTEDLEAAGYPPGHEALATVMVKNPLNEEMARLRTSLLPGLLASLQRNLTRGATSVALFEEGRVFFDRPWPADRRVPDQPERLAFALTGPLGTRRVGQEPPPADVFTATGIWRRLASALGLEDHALQPASAPGWHPGRCVEVLLGGTPFGYLGEVHPRTAVHYGLSARVAAAELSLAPLLAPGPAWSFVEPSPYPRAEFDLAFEMPDSVPVDRLLRTLAGAAGGLVEEATVFDLYRGPVVAEGSRSVAVRYFLRAPDRTLGGDEVAAVRGEMIAAAEAIGARLRGS